MGCDHASSFNGVYNVQTGDSTVVDGSGFYRNYNYSDYGSIVEKFKNKTWAEEINKSFEKNKEHKCFGYRKPIDASMYETTHTYLTYDEVSKYADLLASNIHTLELATLKNYDYEGELSCVGIFARNCSEWYITDLACQRSCLTSVVFYATLGDKAFEHIFKQTQTTTLFVSADSADNFINYYNEFKFTSLKNVVLFDFTLYSDDTIVTKLKATGLNILSFSDLIQDKGKKVEFKSPTPETIMTLCYTSGTTNLPKGVKLSQNNFFAGQFSLVETELVVNTDTVHLSYLPLAHIMERLIIHTMAGNGALICFIATGDVKKYLSEDIALTRPTILAAVPRVLTLFHQSITSALNATTGCSKSLVEKAIEVKKSNFQKNSELKHSLYDSLVFKKVREKFGGRVNSFVTGSAPLSKEVADDIKIFFSAPIVEAYGMTEITGALVVSNKCDFTNDSAGGVLRVNEFKLANRRELNYHSETLLDGELSPTGEVCCRGLNVFSGYFLDKEKTSEAFDSDGWLKTGDVGRILPNGKGLKIIDRVKEIFKLSQGEYIAPSKLENSYIKSKYVAQLCIYGDSFKNFLVAIIVPNKVEITKFLKEKGLLEEGQEVEAHYSNKDLHEAIKADFDSIAKINNYNSLEKPQKFIISRAEFTVQNELVTPTMKLVRNKIEAFFKKEINEAYIS